MATILPHQEALEKFTKAIQETFPFIVQMKVNSLSSNTMGPFSGLHVSFLLPKPFTNQLQLFLPYSHLTVTHELDYIINYVKHELAVQVKEELYKWFVKTSAETKALQFKPHSEEMLKALIDNLSKPAGSISGTALAEFKEQLQKPGYVVNSGGYIGYGGAGSNSWTQAQTIVAAKPKLKSVGSEDVLHQLTGLIPNLNTHHKCPADGCVYYGGNANPLATIIMHLNDKHAWSRDKIADWLESLDVDLQFPEMKYDSSTPA